MSAEVSTRRNRTRGGAPLLVLLAVLALGACRAPDESSPGEQPVVTGERIAFPKDGKQTVLIRSELATPTAAAVAVVPARLAWNEDHTSRIFSPVAGRVVSLAAVQGQWVKSGQSLAAISSPEFGQAQAEVRRAGIDLALARKSVARAQELHGAGVIAEKDLHAAQADLERAQAEQERTVSREQLFGRGGATVDQQYRLASPINGVVAERNLNPGQEVRPDQAQPGNPPLFLVTDPRSLWAQLELPESLLGVVRPGMTITLRSAAFPGETFVARIDAVGDAVDAGSRTVKARASVANPGRRLKSEMFVNAEIALPTDVAPRVPAAAVLLLGNQQFAFVDEGDFLYARRAVTADEVRLGLMRITSGVKTGEKVVVQGGLLLQQLLSARAQQ